MTAPAGWALADLTALSAIDTNVLAQGLTFLVVSEKHWYIYLDPDSTTADGTYVVNPSAGTGKWHRVEGYGNDFTERIEDIVEAFVEDTATINSTYSDGAATLTLNVVTGSLDNSHINTTANISQSKIENLTTDLGNKANSTHTHTSTNITDIIEAVQDIVGAFVTGSSGIEVTYNDVTNVLSIGFSSTTLDEAIDDRVSNLLVAGSNVTLDYDDVANILTIDATASGGGGSGALDWDTAYDATDDNWDNAY